MQIVTAQVVSRVLAGRNLDRELAAAREANPALSSNEKQALQSIAFDVFRNLGLLNAQLDVLLTQPLTDQPVRHLLLVSLAQLQYSRTAPHMVVDQAVRAVEAAGFTRAKGLVNAILRNYLRAPEKFSRGRFKDVVAVHDHPRWWIERLRNELGDRANEVLVSALVHPPMHLRVNLQKASVETVLSTLAAANLSASALGDTAVALAVPVSVHAIPNFDSGWVSVQDFGAQQAAMLLDARDGMRVLDACAAPGGKTAHIAERAKVDLVALDNDRVRLARVTANLKRLDLPGTTVLADAGADPQWWDRRPFERVLLDAPCSGSGVTRRHPDIKWIRRESDLARFQKTQITLLTALWQTLAVGGRLLYATCSVFRTENEDVVSTFLAGEKSALHVPIIDNLRTRIPDAMSGKSGLGAVLLPNDKHDGFFYAMLEKTADQQAACEDARTRRA